MEPEALELFHPLIRKWFEEKLGRPTGIQALAWPRIAKGEHVLITAPTGSGKTLTAFLWALQQLITGQWPGGRTRVLYVSPLKALNNDLQRNLLKPLQELQACFAAAAEPFPAIRVLTRSGDTLPNERRQMLRKPPEILITTPESLNLLLSSKNNRLILNGLQTVILDEIHAVLDGKRGTHLITAVDRLTLLAGECQRIALSATVRPLEPVAAFVGGLTMQATPGVAPEDYRYEKRPVTILQSAEAKRYQLTVEAIGLEGLEDDEREEKRDAFWQALAAALTKEIRAHTATLVFANTRRTVEKLTRYINEAAGETLVYSHHGSLARELRLAVEQKLKNGELQGIVATNSLELGIDIGALDAVLLVQTPPSLTAAIQRVGRAGHGVGQVSRGGLYPVHGNDLVTAAVTGRSLPAGDIEPIAPLEGPLDVLAQVLISMTAVETWSVDELYAFLKTSYPYRNLPRKSYDLLLEMLAGRYAATRLRELRPRIVLDKLEGTVKACDGAARLVYQGGGTIPDRGYYDLRLMDTKAKIGELDEEFVWERSLGETFMLGSRIWRIMRVTHNDVEVAPGDRTINIIPFWRSEEQNRNFYYAEKIGLFLAEAQEHQLAPEWFAEQPAFINWSAEALQRLIDFLKLQQEVTGQLLPHRQHILIEHCADALGTADSKQVIVHTLWGGRVNRPWAMALAAAWERKFGYPLETYVGNNCVLLMLPHSFATRDLFTLVSPQNLETLLRDKLESSGFFGAKFRENAGRALLLPKTDFKRRMPLWLNRLRAKKLMAAVAPYADFPIMLETWRTCLQDEFDLDSARKLLDEISDGRIMISEAVTHRPSPFASDVIWRRTNKYMYADDTPLADQQSGLSQELLQELVYAPHLRPAIPVSLVRELDGKLKRTAPGYEPADGSELLLWLKERLFIPADEAEELWAAMERAEPQAGDKQDRDQEREQLQRELAGKAAWLHLPGAEQPGLCALEMLPRIAAVWGQDLAQLDLRPLLPAAGEQLADGLAKAVALGKQQAAGQAKAAAFEGQLTADATNIAALGEQLADEPVKAVVLGEQLAGEPANAVVLGEHLPDDPARAAALEEREMRLEPEALGNEIALFVHQWLTYYGPVPRDFVRRRLGLPAETCAQALATLLGEEYIVADVLTQGSVEAEICDRENLERLLLMVRRAGRLEFNTLPAAQLPLFLASYQGVVDKGLSLEELQERLDKLFGYVAPAGLWEEAILPARLEPYYNTWLDSLLQTSDLIWFGGGQKRTGFCLGEDWELFQPEGERRGGTGKNLVAGKASETDEAGQTGVIGKARATGEACGIIGMGKGGVTGQANEAGGAVKAGEALEAQSLFPDSWGKYDFIALSRYTGLPSDLLTGRLWDYVWQGQVTNDSFAVLRKGMLTKFTPFQAEERRGFSRRAGYNRWSASRPLQGNWYILAQGEEQDPIAQEELNKDRIRQLFARYGVLFRELLQQELPAMQWGRIFRSLRLMEFAGEIYAGHFFEQINGLQFISQEANRFLSRGLNEDSIYWLNAVDPASPCGLKLPGMDPDLPARLATNYIVLHGARLKVVVKRSGKELLIKAEPDDPALPEYFAFCKTLLTRDFNPLKKIVVETVNNRPVLESPYKKALLEIGFTVEYKSLVLRRQY